MDMTYRSIAFRRAQLGLTQEGLAERCGVTRATMNQIEGARTTPSLPVALAIADALLCDVKELFLPMRFEERGVGDQLPRDEVVEIQDALLAGRSLLIGGPQNSGKTTLLSSATRLLGERHRRLLFFEAPGELYVPPESSRYVRATPSENAYLFTDGHRRDQLVFDTYEEIVRYIGAGSPNARDIDGVVFGEIRDDRDLRLIAKLAGFVPVYTTFHGSRQDREAPFVARLGHLDPGVAREILSAALVLGIEKHRGVEILRHGLAA